MSKPKYIEAIYSQAIQFDLKKLKINWDDVDDYWVKHGTLHVLYKDKSIKKYEPNDEPKMDWKHPVSTDVYDKDWFWVV